MTPPKFTLRDFSLRENHLAGYPSLLSQEHNISLKDNSNELSQISSNDETSLNNNIIGNFKNPLVSLEKLNKQGATQ
jgi:hypothetical protein